MKLSRGTMFMGFWVSVVVASVVGGLYVLGSPVEERARRIDRRRVLELQGIAAATDVFWSRHTRLPASLEDLRAEPGIQVSTVDPVSLQSYEYTPLDSAKYQLCAHFDSESGEIRTVAAENLWAHAVGRQCFDLKVEDVVRNRDGRR